MAWKRREKALTEEEAVELARGALAKYWFGSEALIAGVKAGNKAIACPLNPKFLQGTWILLFADPMEFSSENSLVYFREWHRRYSSYDIDFIHFFCPSYAALRTPEAIKALFEKDVPPWISVLDADLSLSSAFSVTRFPKVVGIHQGQVIFEQMGEEDLDKLENQLQAFLRREDPGLPLLPIFHDSTRSKSDLGKIEFADPKANVAFGGNWIRKEDRIITSDPAATLKFTTSAAYISVIARSPDPAGRAAEISVEIDDNLPYESIFGRDLATHEEGLAALPVSEIRLYDVLAKMPAQKKVITLRFPFAAQCPIELFGLRFGAAATSRSTGGR